MHGTVRLARVCVVCSVLGQAQREGTRMLEDQRLGWKSAPTCKSECGKVPEHTLVSRETHSDVPLHLMPRRMLHRSARPLSQPGSHHRHECSAVPVRTAVPQLAKPHRATQGRRGKATARISEALRHIMRPSTMPRHVPCNSLMPRCAAQCFGFAMQPCACSAPQTTPHPASIARKPSMLVPRPNQHRTRTLHHAGVTEKQRAGVQSVGNAAAHSPACVASARTGSTAK